MNQVYPNAGLTQWLTKMTGADLHWHLFTNNATVDRGVVLGSLTEAVWTGYTLAVVGAIGWTFGLAGNIGVAQNSAIAFLNTSGAPVQAYGYYVTDNTDTFLLAVGKFDAFPITIPDGDQYTMIPSIADLSLAIVSP